MSVNKICFVMQTPLTKRDYVRFGMDLLKTRGFQVCVVELTALLNPDYLQHHGDESEYAQRIRINTQKELSEFLENNSDCLMIDLVGARACTAFIYRLFYRFNIDYASVFSGVIPALGVNKRGIAVKLLGKAKDLLGFGDMPIKESWQSLEKLFYFMPNRIGRIQPPRFIVLSTNKFKQRLPMPDKNTRVILAHTFDYDIYLQREKKVKTDEKYAVFLDEYFPYHPDFLIKGNRGIDLNAIQYYTTLNKFMDWFQATYGIPVVVAAHPSSEYDQKPGCFPKRDVVKGKTAELVQGAQYVFMHCSTSINFAVLYKKPIMFLTSNEIAATMYGKFIINFAQIFNKQPINLDDRASFEKGCQLEVDEKCYKNYYLDYIKTPGSPDKLLWDIVADHIEGTRNEKLEAVKEG